MRRDRPDPTAIDLRRIFEASLRLYFAPLVGMADAVLQELARQEHERHTADPDKDGRRRP